MRIKTQFVRIRCGLLNRHFSGGVELSLLGALRLIGHFASHQAERQLIRQSNIYMTHVICRTRSTRHKRRHNTDWRCLRLRWHSSIQVERVLVYVYITTPITSRLATREQSIQSIMSTGKNERVPVCDIVCVDRCGLSRVERAHPTTPPHMCNWPNTERQTAFAENPIRVSATHNSAQSGLDDDD